jgi:hypothetical protein
VSFLAGLTPCKSLPAACSNVLTVRAADAKVLKSIGLTGFAAKIKIAKTGENS